MSPGAPAFVAADWGTTRLRLWLMDDSGTPLAERRSDEGMATAGTKGFAATLEDNLAAMGAPADLPVVACGMVGARQGWVEAPYVAVPAPLENIFGAALSAPGASRDVRIVPGVSQPEPARPEVMRGEETQIAGALASMRPGRHVICLPGTHSKWAEVDDGRILAFRTAMTGELFALLAEKSILRHSLGEPPEAFEPDDAFFAAGLRAALAEPHGLISSLFSIRAGGLLLGQGKRAAAARLSGMLIGHEIAAMRALARDAGMVLIASGRMGALYAAALSLAGLAFDSVDADDAVRRGLTAAARTLFGIGARETAQ